MLQKLNLLKNNLRFHLQRNTQQFFSTNKDPVNVNKEKFVYQQFKDRPNIPKKPEVWTSQVKKEIQEKDQQQQFQQFQQQLQDKAQKKLEGIVDEKQTIEQDEIYGNEIPVRPIDKITNKELYWLSRRENYYKISDQFINYLTEFQSPFQIYDPSINNIFDEIIKNAGKEINNPNPNFVIEEFYQQNKEIFKLLEDLRQKIPQLNYKQLPDLGLKLRYELRYRQDVFLIWKVFREEVNKHLHNYTPIEYAKLMHGMTGSYPKSSDPIIEKGIQTIIDQEVQMLTISEMLHLIHSFRNQRKGHIQKKLMIEILNRQKQIQKPDDYANILYTHAICRVKEYRLPKFREPDLQLKEANKILKQLYPGLIKSISSMSLEGLTRLSISLMLLRVEDYEDILMRVEKTILAKHDNLNPFFVGNIIYAFGKIQNGRTYGSDGFYNKFEEYINKFWDQLDDLDRSRIFYSYSNRAVLSQSLKDKILKWLEKRMLNLGYQELQNVAYGLMYNNVMDKNLWKNFILNISKQELVVPANNYMAFKLAYFYIQIYFPNWNYIPYEEACRNAEIYFSTLRIKNSYQQQQSFKDMVYILVQGCNIEPLILVEFENLFLIDFAIMPQKVGILILNEQYKVSPGKSSPFFDLKCKILEANGWGLVKVDWKLFQDMEESRNAWLKGEIERVFQEQNKKYTGSEQERWQQTFGKYQEIREKQLLDKEKIDLQVQFEKK